MKKDEFGFEEGFDEDLMTDLLGGLDLFGDSTPAKPPANKEKKKNKQVEEKTTTAQDVVIEKPLDDELKEIKNKVNSDVAIEEGGSAAKVEVSEKDKPADDTTEEVINKSNDEVTKEQEIVQDVEVEENLTPEDAQAEVQESTDNSASKEDVFSPTSKPKPLQKKTKNDFSKVVSKQSSNEDAKVNDVDEKPKEVEKTKEVEKPQKDEFAAFAVQQNVKSIEEEDIETEEDDDEIDFGSLLSSINEPEEEVSSTKIIPGHPTDSAIEEIFHEVYEEETSSDFDAEDSYDGDGDDEDYDDTKEAAPKEISFKKGKGGSDKKKADKDKMMKSKPSTGNSIIQYIGVGVLCVACFIAGNITASTSVESVDKESIVSDYQMLSNSIDDTLFDISLYLNNRISDDVLLTQLTTEVLPYSDNEVVNDIIEEYEVIFQELINSFKSATTTSQIDSAVDNYVTKVTALETEINSVFKAQFEKEDVDYVETSDGDLDALL